MYFESTMTLLVCQSTSVGTTAGSHPPPVTDVLPLCVAMSGRPSQAHPAIRRRTWFGK